MYALLFRHHLLSTLSVHVCEMTIRLIVSVLGTDFFPTHCYCPFRVTREERTITSLWGPASARRGERLRLQIRPLPRGVVGEAGMSTDTQPPC